MSGTLKDGYYNYDNHMPGCWLVEGRRSWFVKDNGAKIKEDDLGYRVTIEMIADGRFVPSLWLPPGVTHNPAMGLDPKYQGRFTKNDSVSKKARTGEEWYVEDDVVVFEEHDAEPAHSRDYPTLEAFKSAVDRGELFRVEADEKPAFFETVEEEEASLEAEPTPESLDDHEAASRFVNLQAISLVLAIVDDHSPLADQATRRVFTTPSQLDRAIAARVVELLS